MPLKVVGYGLCDVEVSQGKICDPRFRPEGIVMLDQVRGMKDYPMEGFIEHIKRSTFPEGECDRLIRGIRRGGSDRGLKGCVIHSDVMGLEHVVCLIPPSHFLDLVSSRNMVDIMEESFVYQGKDRYMLLNRGVPPWDRRYMDVRSGVTLLFPEAEDFVSRYRGLQEEEKRFPSDQGESLSKTKEELNRLARRLGFDHYLHAAEHVRPIIPDVLLLFCQYGYVFKNPDMVLQLRPMVYVHW